MKKKIRYIVLFIYLVVAGTLVFFVFENNFKKPTLNLEKNNSQENIIVTSEEKPIVKINKEAEKTPKPELNNKLVTIVVGDLVLNSSFSEGQSLYDVLIKEKDNNRLNFVSKEFSGMGFFVSEIGNLKEGDGKYLIYFVNGKSPNIGISSYILKDQDIIKWELK